MVKIVKEASQRGMLRVCHLLRLLGGFGRHGLGGGCSSVERAFHRDKCWDGSFHIPVEILHPALRIGLRSSASARLVDYKGCPLEEFGQVVSPLIVFTAAITDAAVSVGNGGIRPSRGGTGNQSNCH